MTYSVPIPSTVKHCGCMRMMPGAFSDMLGQHVVDVVGWCICRVSYLIGCVVKAVDEKCNGGELVCGLDVGVAEKAAVEVCEKQRRQVQLFVQDVLSDLASEVVFNGIFCCVPAT